MNLVLKIEIKKIYFCNCSLTYFCLALVLLLQLVAGTKRKQRQNRNKRYRSQRLAGVKRKTQLDGRRKLS